MALLDALNRTGCSMEEDGPQIRIPNRRRILLQALHQGFGSMEGEGSWRDDRLDRLNSRRIDLEDHPGDEGGTE